MKKLAVTLLLFLLAVSAFAQKSVNDMDGTDWSSWSMATKTGFIQGFYAAYVSVMAFAQSKNEENPNIDDVMKAVNDQFYIDLTVGQLGKKIDTFYSDESRLKYPIWQVVVYLSGKAWWE